MKKLTREDVLKQLASGNKDFSFQDLSGIDLREADLFGANLREANLRGSDLSGIDLSRAYLREADLEGSDLEGSDLSRANLREADLESANLAGAKIDFQIEEGLLQKASKHALANDKSLDMYTWHKCETTHCIAGWACHLAKNGKELEKEYGTEIAGLLLLGVEAHSHFFDDNATAKKWLEQQLQK